MTSPLSDTKSPEATEETLRLKCPTCSGGLNLKRRHLGITGQCVHCQTPLTALEKDGTIQVVAGLDPHFSPAAPEVVEVPESMAPPLSFGSLVTEAETAIARDQAPHHAPSLETVSFETPAVTPPASAWGFPDREIAPAFATSASPAPEPPRVHEEIPQSFLASLEPASPPEPAPLEPAPSPFLDTPTPSFAPISPGNTNLFGTVTAPVESPFATAPTAPAAAAPVAAPAAASEENPFPAMATGFSLSSSTESNLLVDRTEIRDASLPPAPAFSKSALFGDQSSAPKESFSSMFKNADDSSEINPAWGTKVPHENHASISPFATGSASGGGFAESLFRDKVGKETEKIESPLFASPFGKIEDSSPVAPAKEEFQKKVVLDGDGRPMKAMTPEEEANFAKHLFAVEKTHKRPRWVKKVIKTAVTLAVLGAIGTGVYFVTPEEKLAEWKEKAYIWLEPGLAILDYVPEGLRPDWLPRTDLGIDAGVDENGVPKKKLNAFEGLDKLKGDIGDMRGTAEDELENINKL
jgi:hypothetical protein